MKGYKVTDKDMRGLNFQFEIGKTFIHKGEVKICESGFHFHENPLQCVQYYFSPTKRLFEVECEEVSNDISMIGRVCGKITFIREIVSIDLELTEEQKIKAVKPDGRLIRFFQNPSEKVCLAAVKEDGLAINYIQNPTEETMMEAVKQNSWAIRYISDPTPAVIALAKSLS